jgi:hypothetical protein
MMVKRKTKKKTTAKKSTAKKGKMPAGFAAYLAKKKSGSGKT